MDDLPEYNTEAEIEPMWPGCPTVVAVFYPPPTGEVERQGLEVYLDRIKLLAKFNYQTILYVSPEVSAEIKSYRDDKW